MKKEKWIFYVLVSLLLVVFCCSAAYVIHYLTQSQAQKEVFDQLSELVSDIRSGEVAAIATTTPDSPDTPGLSTAPTDEAVAEQTMLPEYEALYNMNPDIVGWIHIDGTVIDYPVMQTPDRVDYYLKRNFYGMASDQGCIYVREECDFFAPSDNLTIYGHHMRDGSMFASLSSYTSRSTWEENSLIQLDTLYEYHTYQIFAVFKTTASVGKGFSYHLFADAQNEEEFQKFVSQCKSLALYDTGITPQYGDKLICLSTCDYSRTNGRLVVAAVRID